MTTDNWITLLIGIGTVLASIIGTYLVFNIQIKRVTSQNRKDDADTAAKALEAANLSIDRQVEQETQITTLKEEISTLRVFMTRQRYRAVIEFEDGPALANVDPVLMIARLERVKEVSVAK